MRKESRDGRMRRESCIKIEGKEVFEKLKKSTEKRLSLQVALEAVD